MSTGSSPHVVAKPVFWRAMLARFALFVPAIVVYVLLNALLGGGELAFFVVYFTALAVGVVIGLAIMRRGLPVELGQAGLRGPASWGHNVTIALDELDWYSLPSRGLAWRLGQQKIRALDGRRITVPRWSYAPQAMRDLDAELARLARVREGGA